MLEGAAGVPVAGVTGRLRVARDRGAGFGGDALADAFAATLGTLGAVVVATIEGKLGGGVAADASEERSGAGPTDASWVALRMRVIARAARIAMPATTPTVMPKTGRLRAPVVAGGACSFAETVLDPSRGRIARGVGMGSASGGGREERERRKTSATSSAVTWERGDDGAIAAASSATV